MSASNEHCLKVTWLKVENLDHATEYLCYVGWRRLSFSEVIVSSISPPAQGEMKL